MGQPDRWWSDVLELKLPETAMDSGVYLREPGKAFSAEVVWKYGPRAGHEGSFYCTHISGVQRLPNGNTLITQGPQATVIEVTPEGQEVWRWLSPVVADKR